MAENLVKITSKLEIPFIYKSSFDKANRTSANSPRGTGIDEGLEILLKVKERFFCPLLTDIHNESQCASAAQIVDILQIPAFFLVERLAKIIALIIKQVASTIVVFVRKFAAVLPVTTPILLPPPIPLSPSAPVLCKRITIISNIAITM